MDAIQREIEILKGAIRFAETIIRRQAAGQRVNSSRALRILARA